MDKRRLKKIERQIQRLGGPRYTVCLPSLEDWANPQPITAEEIEKNLRELETGTLLYWPGCGNFYKYGAGDQDVIQLSRSSLPQNHGMEEM